MMVMQLFKLTLQTGLILGLVFREAVASEKQELPPGVMVNVAAHAFYWAVTENKIFMLLAYAKNERENLTNEQLKILKNLVEEEFKNGQ